MGRSEESAIKVEKRYTSLSESRSGLGGLLEDIGPILGVLGVMVSTIRKPLKNWSDSFFHNSQIQENGRDMAITVIGFRSTFNDGSVRLMHNRSADEQRYYRIKRYENDGRVWCDECGKSAEVKRITQWPTTKCNGQEEEEENQRE